MTGISQNFIGKKKAAVKKALNQYLAKNNLPLSMMEDKDSTLVIAYKDQTVQPVVFIYTFNKKGRCWSEKIIAGCDSCFTKYLYGVLDQKKYGWKKINENQYVSNYVDRMMLEFPPENKDFSYVILRTAWTKELYRLLTGH